MGEDSCSRDRHRRGALRSAGEANHYASRPASVSIGSLDPVGSQHEGPVMLPLTETLKENWTPVLVFQLPRAPRL